MEDTTIPDPPEAQRRYDGFLSYASGDADFVTKLYKELARAGASVFFDKQHIKAGDVPFAVIKEAIADSEWFIACVGHTPGRYAVDELTEAKSRGKKILTIRLPGCTLDDMRHAPSALNERSHFDFSGGFLTKFGLDRLATMLGLPEVANPGGPNPLDPGVRDNLPEADRIAIEDLADHLTTENLTVFLGASAVDTLSLSIYLQVARALSGELNVAASWADIGFLADLAELVSRAPTLANKWQTLANDYLNVVPQVYEQVCALIKALRNRVDERVPRKMPTLIVTTNVDLTLEKVLLQEGISFTRIVQRLTPATFEDRQDWLVVNQYPVVRVEEGVVSLPFPEDLSLQPNEARWRSAPIWEKPRIESLITEYNRKEISWTQRQRGNDDHAESAALRVEQLQQPIVYKFLGSLDIDGSTIISRARQFEYQRSLLERGSIPDQITAIIHESPVVFFGHSAINPDYHLVRNTLLKGMNARQGIRCLVHQRPQIVSEMSPRIATRLWEGLKDMTETVHGIKVIEQDPAVFLKLLIEEFERPR